MAQTVSANTVYFSVPDGNVEVLKHRLQDAQSRPNETVVLLLDGIFRFGPQDALPEVRTDVSVRGDAAPAYFFGVDGGPANLLRITRPGSLRLTNISFEDFDPRVGGDGEQAGLVVNSGLLNLAESQFQDNSAELECASSGCDAYKPLILNTTSGDFRAAQVSIVDSGVTVPEFHAGAAAGAVLTNRGSARMIVTQLFLQKPGYAPSFLNSGEIQFRNVTLKTETSRGAMPGEWIESSGSLRISNSIIDGFASEWCSNATSSGFNLVDNPQCQISGREDIVGKSAGLRWRPVTASWQHWTQKQILSHALVPIAASPAVDSANDDWCPENSLESFNSFRPDSRTLDGDGDGIYRCDRGAFEIPLGSVDNGGINGLYYNPDADGHYVYVADTKFNTMVMWTTFDSRGKQAWIFGIADKAVAGRALIADAYINRDGRVSLSGQFDPATSEHWGRLEVELDDCDEGNFAFYSDVSGFGSGEFQIQRLAHVKRLGCQDHPAEN